MRREPSSVRRLAYSAEEAAEALGVGRSTFFREIAPQLRCVRIGRKRLFAVAELEAWLERNQSLVFDRAA